MASNAERQRRWYERHKAGDPVQRYCQAVVAWDSLKRRTPQSGRLALDASAILGLLAARPTRQSLPQLMGFGDDSSQPATPSEAGRVALAALGRAQAELDAGGPTDTSVRAGLHHARFLATTERRTEAGNALFRLHQAQLGSRAGHDHSLAPRTSGPAWDCCNGYPVAEDE